MNKIIRELKETISLKERELKEAEYGLHEMKDTLRRSLIKETAAIDSVLKYNVVDILTMITKSYDGKLKCCGMYGVSTYQGEANYLLTDGNYKTYICAKDGIVIRDNKEIDNDGGGKNLYEMVDALLTVYINPYCEDKKDKYIK